MTITTARLIDATNYELTSTGQGVWEWTEDGSEIGVRIELTYVNKEALLQVISHETKGYLMLTEDQIETRLRIAVDVMQFAENYDQKVWPFDELCDALNAIDRDYGFSGSSSGLDISIGFGGWLEKQEVGYCITDEDGLTYYAGTVAGLRSLYPKVIAENVRRGIGWTNRWVNKLANSEK